MTFFPTRTSRKIVPLVALLLAACSGKKSAVRPSPTTTPGRTSATRVDTVRTRDPDLEERAARLELQVLDGEARIVDLEARLAETRREVVRAMSRVQSSATRAEAASALAEAEVDVRSAPEGTQARQLVALGSAEFESENYGGALYLANQAKALVAASRAARSDLRAGETPFTAPLRLQTTGRCNVREGPARDARILFTLERGTPVTGHSMLEEWVKVAAEDGRGGWVHQTLVGRRTRNGG